MMLAVSDACERKNTSMKYHGWSKIAFAMLLTLIIPILAACGGGGSAPAAAPTAAQQPTAVPAAEPTAAPAAEPTAAPAAEPTAAPAAEPTAAPAAGASGGALRILYWQAVTTLNPHLATGTKDSDASRLIVEPLASWDDKGELSLNLAAEVPTRENGDISEDLKTVTWKLKPGLKWSDGSDFTADDVVFTWQYCADPATACFSSAAFAPIDKVEAVDPQTVKITWKQPNPNPYISFVGVNGQILQKKQFAECIGAAAAQCPANNQPIGTGPYKITDFKPGDVVLYEKNPLYRDAASLGFDTVEFKGGGDAASAGRAVCETGEVDYAWNLQVEAAVLSEIVAGGQCDLAKPAFGIERVLVNFANPDPALGDKRSEPDQPHPILSDPKVRQALSLAIDRKTMAEQIYGEAGVPTCNMMTHPESLASPNTKCDQDLAKANQLLDEAGWKDSDGDGVRDKDGKPLVLTFSTSINALRQKEQALIKADWAKIGVQTNLKAVDSSVFFSSDPGNPDTANHFYTDVEMFTNSNGDPDPTQYFANWTCAQMASKANNWNLANPHRYCSKEYDAIVDQLQKETDPAKRKELFVAANDKLVNDGVVIPLIDRFTPSGYAKGLVGPTGPAFDSLLWNIAAWHK
jgi:peptide/nickel transport system substrate-binding protein